MISLEKLNILTPLQKLPKNVLDLSELIVATAIPISIMGRDIDYLESCQITSPFNNKLGCFMQIKLKRLL